MYAIILLIAFKFSVCLVCLWLCVLGEVRMSTKIYLLRVRTHGTLGVG